MAGAWAAEAAGLAPLRKDKKPPDGCEDAEISDGVFVGCVGGVVAELEFVGVGCGGPPGPVAPDLLLGGTVGGWLGFPGRMTLIAFDPPIKSG